MCCSKHWSEIQSSTLYCTTASVCLFVCVRVCVCVCICVCTCVWACFCAGWFFAERLRESRVPNPCHQRLLNTHIHAQTHTQLRTFLSACPVNHYDVMCTCVHVCVCVCVHVCVCLCVCVCVCACWWGDTSPPMTEVILFGGRSGYPNWCVWVCVCVSLCVSHSSRS